MPRASACAPAGTTPAEWTSVEVSQLFTVSLPRAWQPDTSGGTSLEFYHGGGRFIGPEGTMVYRVETRRSAPQRPRGPTPDAAECVSLLPNNWERRMTISSDADRKDRGIVVTLGFRRLTEPDRWLRIVLVGADSTVLASVASSVRLAPR